MCNEINGFKICNRYTGKQNFQNPKKKSIKRMKMYLSYKLDTNERTSPITLTLEFDL